MNQNQIRVTLTRGGREFRERTFSLDEARSSLFDNVLNEEGVTRGLGDQFDIYVKPLDGAGEREVPATRKGDMTLEGVLRSASEDGEITGKSFVIDCTAEHRGAGGRKR
jgi:hypothetical protein